MMRRVVTLAAGLATLALALVAIACGSSSATTTVTVPGTVTNGGATNVSDQVASGAHYFVQFACAQCHGERGVGNVLPTVPALNTVAKTLTPAQLRTIIDHGLGVASDPTQTYMPIWGQLMSTRQVNDLVAYIRADLPDVPGATPPPDITAQGQEVRGAFLYQRYGCVNCHGPNGRGGVPNPQSADKAIPPLSGAAFFSQFNTDQKLIDVIRSGSVIGRPPIVSMPHWDGIIPDDQMQALLAYIKSLRTN